MTVAIAKARQTVLAPVRRPRRFGLLSVVDVVDGGEQHWMLGGLTADGEECSKPESTGIVCGPTPNKQMRSWYSDIDSDPWLAYMYETCKTIGRYDEASSKLRARFQAAEQSAIEAGFQDNVLNTAQVVGTGAYPTVRQAISNLEDYAASEYGGQIILHLPFVAAAAVADGNYIQRVGDHLETLSGNLVSVGNYHPNHNGGSATVPVVYATGAVSLHRSSLLESGPVFDRTTNDYFTLIERGYGALVDCLKLSATGTLCGCGTGAVADPAGGDGGGGASLDEGSSMSAETLGVVCADTNGEVAANLNAAGVIPNPTSNWGVGHCASVDCGGDIDREVRWNGTTWVGC